MPIARHPMIQIRWATTLLAQTVRPEWKQRRGLHAAFLRVSSPLTRRAVTFDAHTGVFSRLRAFKCLEQGVAGIMRIVDDDAAWEHGVLERRTDGVDPPGAAFPHSFPPVVTKRPC